MQGIQTTMRHSSFKGNTIYITVDIKGQSQSQAHVVLENSEIYRHICNSVYFRDSAIVGFYRQIEKCLGHGWAHLNQINHYPFAHN